MKHLKLILILCLFVGCANTDDVDDSDVTADMESGSGEASQEEDSLDEETDGGETIAPTPPVAKSSSKAPYEARGDSANLLYNIASGSLKKSDVTLAYTVKCSYTIKPLTIKSCMVKSGFLPNDAKSKIGKLLLEAKNLPRKKISANEAVVITNYSCTKGKTNADTICKLEKA
ncbi:MAG: hypothetical protein IT287_04690 [Bdellovibrionaceae bacterium]|nr:hypothetical protein [Pseudobdellovibrionaceae bacterium]